MPEDESETDEIQIGKVEEYEEFIAGDQEDVLMEDADADPRIDKQIDLAESKASSEDVRAADLYAQDSDDGEVDDADASHKAGTVALHVKLQRVRGIKCLHRGAIELPSLVLTTACAIYCSLVRRMAL